MGTIKEYDKLIRDKIPDIIRSHGNSCDIDILFDEDYKKYLYKKLQEEVDEFFEDDSIEELADITEIIYAILDLKKSNPEELEKIRDMKFQKRGGFQKKLRLKRVVE